MIISNSWHTIESGNGIGLGNLKSQLNHLYPGNYSLRVDTDKPNEFSVNLVLTTKR
jgi:sensor histidine kinase YesM